MIRSLLRVSPMAALFGVALFGAGCNFNPKDQVPAFTMTSEAFFNDFMNSPGGSDKYRNQVVELTGKLGAIGNSYDQTGPAVFSLEGPPGKSDRVSCFVAERFPWREASPGQTVKLKGKGNPRLLVPSLVDCVVMEVTGDPATRLTADELCKQQTDGVAAEKYRGKYLIVSGEIETVDFDKIGGLIFKTDGKTPKVHALFKEEDKKRYASWKPGQKVELIGLSSINPGAPIIQIVLCLPMDDPK